MNGLKLPVGGNRIERRDFIRVGAGAAAVINMLNGVKASAQARASEGVPWWAARPGKLGVGKPAAIDMHAHWSPATRILMGGVGASAAIGGFAVGGTRGALMSAAGCGLAARAASNYELSRLVGITSDSRRKAA